MSDQEARDEVPADLRSVIREILDHHPVRFAILFGSAGRDAVDERSDVDIAVEFESLRPGDEGYNPTYFDLKSALEAATGRRVDLVDVRSMSPQFARIVFDDGDRLVGSAAHEAMLRRELAGEPPSFSDARARVSAAAARLRDDSSTER